MSQNERILEELKKGGWFSLADSVNLSPPIVALSQRITDLKNEGYEIFSRKVVGKTYQEYMLKPPEVIKLPPAFPAPFPVKKDNNKLF